jgi:hypothetical protein
MLQASGFNQSNEFFNDPEEPKESAQFLMEQNKQLMQMVQQIQSQNANPLAEAEQIKAQASLIKAQTDNQVKMIEAQGKQQLELEKLQQSMTQFIAQKEFDYTKLELEQKTDIPGKGMEGPGVDAIFDPSTGVLTNARN